MSNYIDPLESGNFSLEDEDLEDRNVPYPLLRAIEQNDLNAFRGLVNDPANVNSTNPDFNETALHLAMAVGNEEMVRELLVRETNIFAVTNFGFTVLHYLSSNSASVPCAALILDTVKTKFEPQLLDFVNAVTPNNGSTALSIAASSNKTDLALFLIDRGAKIQNFVTHGRVVSDSLTAALHWFQFCSPRHPPSFPEVQDQVRLIRSMIAQGANVTAAHLRICVYSRSVVCMQAVLDSCSPETLDINSAPDSNNTVLQEACALSPRHPGAPDSVELDSMNLVEYLVTQKGADVNTTPDMPPIFFAARRGAIKVVDFLLKHGARVDETLKDEEGKSILEVAPAKVRALLLEHMQSSGTYSTS